jgi:hypothetical protein
MADAEGNVWLFERRYRPRHQPRETLRHYTVPKFRFDAFRATLAGFRPGSGSPPFPCETFSTDAGTVVIDWSGDGPDAQFSIYEGCDLDAQAEQMLRVLIAAPEKLGISGLPSLSK